jgi:hypothetical protein
MVGIQYLNPAESGGLGHKNPGSIFRAEHGFAPVVERYGSREAVAAEVIKRVSFLAEGIFRQTVEVAGYKVTVTGNVIDEVPKLGSAWVSGGM